MSTFYFKVSVEVEDDLGMATECYDEKYFDQCYVERDEAGNVTLALLDPETKSEILMQEAFGDLLAGADMGSAIGNYSVEYERISN